MSESVMAGVWPRSETRFRAASHAWARQQAILALQWLVSLPLQLRVAGAARQMETSPLTHFVRRFES